MTSSLKPTMCLTGSREGRAWKTMFWSTCAVMSMFDSWLRSVWQITVSKGEDHHRCFRVETRKEAHQMLTISCVFEELSVELPEVGMA
jgi:hypothetical protein